MKVEVRLTERDSLPTVTTLAEVGLVGVIVLARFGMPPLDLHGPLHFVGIMDPLCGMTRGVAATAHGNLGQAFAYNPASVPFVAGLVFGVVRAAIGMLTGRWVHFRPLPTRLGWALLAVAVAALEVNQQLHADLLME